MVLNISVTKGTWINPDAHTTSLDQLNQCLWRWDAGAHGFWSSPSDSHCAAEDENHWLGDYILTQLEQQSSSSYAWIFFSGLGSPQRGSAEPVQGFGAH